MYDPTTQKYSSLTRDELLEKLKERFPTLTFAYDIDNHNLLYPQVPGMLPNGMKAFDPNWNPAHEDDGAYIFGMIREVQEFLDRHGWWNGYENHNMVVRRAFDDDGAYIP